MENEQNEMQLGRYHRYYYGISASVLILLKFLLIRPDPKVHILKTKTTQTEKKS